MNRVRFLSVFLAAFLFSAAASAMPVFIPILVAAAAYAAGYITIAALVVTLATTALSFIAQSLTKSSGDAPSVSGMTSPGTVSIDNKQTIRQPAAARKIIYGQTRVGGVFGFLHTTDHNQYLYLTVMYAGHRCQEIGDIWAAEEVLPLDVDGAVTSGRYAGNVIFKKHLGATDQVADAMLVAEVPEKINSNHRYREIAYIAGRLKWDNSSGDGTVGSKVWTAGIPNLSAVIKGKNDIYDPRDDTTGYSNNAALVVANYLCDIRYGRAVDYATGINEAALIAAANACDEAILRPDGSTEKRYTTDGAFSSDAQPDEILGRLLAAMHGSAVYDGERWTIFAGVYQEPTLTLTDDDQAQPSTLQTLTSARDSFNGVKGVYVGPDNAWQAADFPAVISDTFKAADGGKERLKDIELPFTISPGRAQRIAKIDLMKVRQEIVETFNGKLSCWRIRTGDTIYRTSTRYGWTLKPFEVANMRFAMTGDAENPTLGVQLTLQEVAPESYEWTADEESEVDPAANTDFPDDFNPEPPSNLRGVESQYITRDGGGVKTQYTLSWDASPDRFVTNGGHYLVRYQATDASSWITINSVIGTSVDLLDMKGGPYRVEVYSVNWAQNPSEMPATLNFTIVGLGAAPLKPQNFTVQAHESSATARWDKITELDVQVGGFVIVKHSPLEDATWETGLFMAEAIPGSANSATLPLVAGKYMAKTRDAGQTYSDDYAEFVQSQSSVQTFVLLSGGSSVQDPAFAGVKTNCAVDSGVLRLAPAGDFDSVPSTDALVSWDWYGAVLSTGNYAYDSVMDLGAVKKFRLTNYCEAAIENVFDDFDHRTEDSDDWAAWDGDASGGEADSWLMVETTQTNPAGSPVWTAPERLHASTFEARGIRFNRKLASYDSNYTVAIFADSVAAERI